MAQTHYRHRGRFNRKMRKLWRRKRLSREQAVMMAESGSWRELTDKQRALFQMFTQERLCMPFSVFHKAVEALLGRPVWTHEFGLNWVGLQHEARGRRPKPSMEDIVNLIPEEKRIVIGNDGSVTP